MPNAPTRFNRSIRWLLTRPPALLLCLATLTALPASARANPSGGSGGATGESTRSVGGGQYWISVPAGYTPSKAIPLLLSLHGDEGKPDYIYSVFKGLQHSSAGAFILAAPKAPLGGGSWYKSDVLAKHSTFVDAVASDLLARYNIDKDRIWAVGWSGGASFLTYYAVKRQDLLAAVAFYMGGSCMGGYDPPPNSCKIPGRFVIGDKDYLYSMAKSKYQLLQSKGHTTLWVELPGVGHSWDPSSLTGTWSWLQQQTLCGTTTPGPTTPPPTTPPPTTPPPTTPPSAEDGGGIPEPDVGTPKAPRDGGLQADPQSQADGALEPGRNRAQGTLLLGGCSLQAAPAGSCWPTLLLLFSALLWSRRRGG